MTGVEILYVAGMTGRDDKVFVAVQVHVNEYRLPGPSRGWHAAKIGNLLERTVPATMKESIAHDLRSVADLAHHAGHFGLCQELSLAQRRIATQHVEHKEIHLAVPVNVGKVHAHRILAGVADG